MFVLSYDPGVGVEGLADSPLQAPTPESPGQGAPLLCSLHQLQVTMALLETSLVRKGHQVPLGQLN